MKCVTNQVVLAKKQTICKSARLILIGSSSRIRENCESLEKYVLTQSHNLWNKFMKPSLKYVVQKLQPKYECSSETFFAYFCNRLSAEKALPQHRMRPWNEKSVYAIVKETFMRKTSLMSSEAHRFGRVNENNECFWKPKPGIFSAKIARQLIKWADNCHKFV